MPLPSEPLIDASHAAFIQGAVGISVAACDRNNVPTLVRAVGCRVTTDRQRVTLFVSAEQSEHLLKCVHDSSSVAAVFSQPSTHRTVQLKGKDAVVTGLQDGDWEQVLAYREAFVHELAPLGFDQSIVRTLLSHPQADIIALSFTPSEAYSQTPGPKAGEPLRAGA